jgi:hypothetical protein
MGMDLKAAVAEAVRALPGASFEEENGVFYLSIPTVDEGEEPEGDDELQPVTVAVYVGEDGETIIARSEVGPYTDDIDLAEVLRWIDSAIFARVYIGAGDEDEGGEALVVEAGALLRHVDGDLIAQMCQEVADLADELGAALYGEDDEDDERDGGQSN